MSDVVVQMIEQLSSGKSRIRLDNGEVWIMYRKEMSLFQIEMDTVLTDDRYKAVRSEVLLKRAKKRAMHLLEKMDRTEEQLRKKLLENEYPIDIVETAISFVKSFHYVDDTRYADTYIRLHGGDKSRAKLLMELRRKGISDEIACSAIDGMQEERDESKMIRAILEKKHYSPETATEEEKRRMYGFLARRGFQSADICREIFA